MKKKDLLKKIEKQFKKINELEKKIDDHEDDMHYVHLARIECEQLREEARMLIRTLSQYTKKADIEPQILRLHNWITDVESKVSMKFYQNIGIYEKIRTEFSSQISKNMNDIKKMKDERSKNR